MLKSTGIVRKIDQLGRVVLPKELRDKFAMGVGDPVEIFTDGERIVLQKYQPGCAFCGSVEDLTHFRGKNICARCEHDFVEQARGTVTV